MSKLHFIQGRIQNLLKRLEPNTSIGIKIVSLRSKEVLFSKNEEKLLSPASNMKLLTGAAAIELLTPDYKFNTIIHNHKNNIIFDEEEIICIATYELAEEFFLQMKDPNTSEEMKKEN